LVGKLTSVSTESGYEALQSKCVTLYTCPKNWVGETHLRGDTLSNKIRGVIKPIIYFPNNIVTPQLKDTHSPLPP
jgi:hypothetical protein